MKSIFALLLLISLSSSPAFADDSTFSGQIGGFFSRIGNAISSFIQSLSQPAGQDQRAPVENRNWEEAPPILAQAVPSSSPAPEPTPAPTFSPTPSSTRSAMPPLPAPSILITTDSTVAIPGQTPENIRWLQFVIQKDGASERVGSFAPVNPSSPFPNAYLSQGPGQYTIHIFASTAQAWNTSAYTFVKTVTVKNEDPRDHEFMLPSIEVQSDSPEVIELARQITSDSSSDLQKARAVHDWITEQIAYDFDGLKDRTYLEKGGDAVSTLNTKLAVCGGYSNLYAALLRSVGIRTKIIHGRLIGQKDALKSKEQICQDETPGHAWNEAYVNSRWISVDPTSDAGYEDGKTGKFHRTSRNQQNFDASPTYFDSTHVKCVEKPF